MRARRTSSGAIRFDCPRCGQAFKVRGNDVGRGATCKICGARFHVPDPDGSSIGPRLSARSRPDEPEPAVDRAAQDSGSWVRVECQRCMWSETVPSRRGRWTQRCPECGNPVRQGSVVPGRSDRSDSRPLHRIGALLLVAFGTVGLLAYAARSGNGAASPVALHAETREPLDRAPETTREPVMATSEKVQAQASQVQASPAPASAEPPPVAGYREVWTAHIENLRILLAWAKEDRDDPAYIAALETMLEEMRRVDPDSPDVLVVRARHARALQRRK